MKKTDIAACAAILEAVSLILSLAGGSPRPFISSVCPSRAERHANEFLPYKRDSGGCGDSQSHQITSHLQNADRDVAIDADFFTLSS